MKRQIDFNYDYPRKLEPIFNTDKRYILLKGGRSSGKSFTVAHRLLELLMCKKVDLLCVREFQKSIEQSNYKIFKRIIEKYKLPFEVQSQKIKCNHNGSEIIFTGLSDQTSDSVKSYEDFGLVWIEEAQRISRKSWEILDPTIRADNAQIYITMNPEVVDAENPITDELIAGLKKDDALVIHINYDENPFCPESMKRMARLVQINKPEEYARIWLGIPDDKHNNKVVKNFTEENIRKCNYQEQLPLYLTCDFNVDPMMWVVAHRTPLKVFFIDEIVIENSCTQEAIQEFIERYSTHKGAIVVNGDASGDYRSTQSQVSNYVIIRNSLERHFRRQVKIDIKKHNPPIRERVNAFNQMVLSDYGQRRIIIDPKCKHLIHNMRYLKYKEGTSQIDAPTVAQIKTDPEQKFLGHIFDAASYLVDLYYPIRKKYAEYRN